MGIILWIIFGALAGWLGSVIVGRDGQQGAVGNVVVGIIGAMVGGWLAGFFGYHGVTGFNLPSLLIAVVGAVTVLAVFNVFAGRHN